MVGHLRRNSFSACELQIEGAIEFFQLFESMPHRLKLLTGDET